jgi:hypothetical protein
VARIGRGDAPSLDPPLLLPHGARVTLLYIDLNGHASAVWEQKGGVQTWGVPSPDARHLAILGYTVDSNVWMLENF